MSRYPAEVFRAVVQRRRPAAPGPRLNSESHSRVPTRLAPPGARAARDGATGGVPALLAAHGALARITVGNRRSTELHRRFSTLANSTLHPPNAGSGEFRRPFRAGGRPHCLRHSPAAAAPRALLRLCPAFAGERRSLSRCLLTGRHHARSPAPCRLSLPRCGLRVPPLPGSAAKTTAPSRRLNSKVSHASGRAMPTPTVVALEDEPAVEQPRCDPRPPTPCRLTRSTRGRAGWRRAPRSRRHAAR